MRNRIPPLLALGTALAAFTMLPAQAHHSFSAEFDIEKPVHLEGEVVRMEWVNPHSWLVIDVPQEDNSVVQWRVEGGAPSALLRRGWNRNSLPAGTKVIVDGYQARDGAHRANARDIQFPDGRRLSLGSSGREVAPEPTPPAEDAE